ncbi:PepSY-associated TM helix domain-containing protein [Achromobacter aloeverae]
MTGTPRLRGWAFVHRWSSLVCTLFLLMLCLTGLPLIFHDEIDDMAGDSPFAAEGPAQTASMDELAAMVRQAYPGRRIQFVAWLEQEGTYRFGLTRPRDGGAQVQPFALVDGRHARIVGGAWSEKDWRHGGVMSFLLRLHTDMLAGTAGSLALAAMGLLFLVALVSGVVLYAPFMRKLPFGTVRYGRSRALRWLDLHNLLGIATLAWAAVVGITGIVNTLDTFVFQAFQARIDERSRARPAPSEGAAAAGGIGLQQAVDAALRALPDGKVDMVAFPGSMFAGARHFVVYLTGSTPLTSRLLQPVVVDAASGEVDQVEAPPWYLWALEGARPLHFGDYGGLPLKVIWALLDVISIVVLGSGVYLWLRRVRGRRGRAPAHGG